MSNCTPCKLSDKVWGIICPDTNTLHRMTFSKSLAEHIAETCGPQYKAAPFTYRRGKMLAPGQGSCNGLYAIIGTKKDLVLRISLFKEGAELMTQDNSRHIEEIYLDIIK